MLVKAPLPPVAAYPDQFVLCTVAFSVPAEAPSRCAVTGLTMRPPGLNPARRRAARREP